jgi:hypothetical protein
LFEKEKRVEKKLPTLKELEGKYEPEELKDLTDEEVLKVFEGVETVWDYEPTEEEQKGIPVDQYSGKVEYFRKWYLPDSINLELFVLFLLRKEDNKAEEYFDLIKSESTQKDADFRRNLGNGFTI